MLKEVHLWAEDTVSANVNDISERLSKLHTSAARDGVAECFVEYLALRVHSPHHYQWLLGCCGPSLRDALHCPSFAPLDEESCKAALRCVLRALDHLHRVCALVHGDVSLGNILFATAATRGAAVLADLEGVSPIGTVPAASNGSYLFVPPERLRDGEVPLRPCDDVWALGVVAYHALTWTAAHPWHVLESAGDYEGNYWALLELAARAQDSPPDALLRRTPLVRCSAAAQSFVSACLSWEAAARPSAAALLRHRWMDPSAG